MSPCYLSGGLALVGCDNSDSNLILDTVNNVIVGHFTAGTIHVSPSTRYIVTLMKPDNITVHYLQDNG